MAPAVPPYPPALWLWLLGAGVALIVGVIAFLVASGLTDRRACGAPPCHDRGDSASGSSRVSRAS
jgi:hypothetical protein